MLTPNSIKNQEFNKAMRGFDPEQVSVFLEKISDEFETLLNENSDMKKKINRLEKQISEYQKIEKNLQATLLTAHESTNKSIESAKKQTTLMIKEAELKAAQIVEKAKQDADSIRDSVLKLREEKSLLIAKLKAIVSTQSEVLDFIETKITSSNVTLKAENNNSNFDVDGIVEKLL